MHQIESRCKETQYSGWAAGLQSHPVWILRLRLNIADAAMMMNGPSHSFHTVGSSSHQSMKQSIPPRSVSAPQKKINSDRYRRRSKELCEIAEGDLPAAR